MNDLTVNVLTQDSILLLARICLSAVFLVSGAHKAVYFAAAQEEFRAARIPAPDLCLVIVIALHFVASIGLILGIHAELCALSLALFTLLVTLWVHDFWNKSGEPRLAASREALANIAIFGGLLVAGVAGPGKYVLQL